MGIVILSFLVIIFLVFAGLFLLFRKYGSRKSPFINLYYWITAVVITPLLYIGLLFIYLSISSSYERIGFDKENWAENRDSRYIYVEDLVDNNKLIGLTSTELKSMLSDADHEDDSTIIYYIGYSPQHFFNMDPDWLVTDLVNDKVSNAYVRE